MYQSQVLKEIDADIQKVAHMDPGYHSEMRVLAGVFFGDANYVGNSAESEKYLSNLERRGYVRKSAGKFEATTWGEQLFYLYVSCLSSHLRPANK